MQELLRGTAGLQIGYDASAKGGGSIQLRGQNSVYTDGDHNAPLIVLDGMVFMESYRKSILMILVKSMY